MIPIILVVAWQIHELQFRQLSTTIRRAGGDITWSRIEDPDGVWIVSFRRQKLDDSTLQILMPTLKRVRRLELDLGYNAVSDSGVEGIGELTNLVRLRVNDTAVSKAMLAELRRQLAPVEVLDEPRF